MAEKQYRAAAVERAMKVQEVIMRAMAKRITWWSRRDSGDTCTDDEAMESATATGWLLGII